MFFTRVRLLVCLCLAVLLAACNIPPAGTPAIPTVTETSAPAPASPTAPAAQTPAIPTATQTSAPAPASPTAPAADTPRPEASATPAQPDERPPEAILILEPGPGSVVTSPVRVAGEADSTFEQSLVVRILLADGTVLVTQPAQIESELGQRGPFALQVPFEFAGQEQGFIQVFATSPRDGGTTHLASVGVTLAGSGEANIVPRDAHPEQIAIFSPAPGETLRGGVAHVEGFALASFEQTLLVEILDEAGNVIGSQPMMVEAPDLGQPGPFRADVLFELAAAGPGRVVVRDVSPAFGGDSHLASVEVMLEP